MKRICKNCRLYNPSSSTCVVQAVVNEQIVKDIPVDPKDKCLWEELGIADHIEQIRLWEHEKKDGSKEVKVEFPEELLGNEKWEF